MHQDKPLSAAQENEDLVSLQEWHMNEIQQGVKEAESGQTMVHEDVKRRYNS